MGGGGDGQTTTRDESTKITTTTTTNIRDIGLTGQHAIDLANIIQGGANQSIITTSGTLNNLIQMTGDSFNRLLGGAGDLVNAAERTAVKMVETGRDVEERGLITEAKAIEIAGEQSKSELERMLPYLAFATVGLVMVLKS